jgi:hypothetical protein
MTEHHFMLPTCMYNYLMTKWKPIVRRSSPIFLILGIAFLAIGFAADQTAFSWIAIAFIVLSLASGGKWSRPKK